MTVRFLVLYTKPDDPQSWEQHYQGTHIPAARNIPGIERLWTGLASRAHDEEPAYYRVTETDFADQADFDAATDSAEWQESAPAGLTVPRPSSRRVSGWSARHRLGECHTRRQDRTFPRHAWRRVGVACEAWRDTSRMEIMGPDGAGPLFLPRVWPVGSPAGR